MTNELRTQVSSGAAASLLLTASAFLPWLSVGDARLVGVPDPAGYFVAAVGVVGVGLSGAAWRGRRGAVQMLLLAGLAGLTTLTVVTLTGPATIADRALAHAEAVALVDNVAMLPPPSVHLSYGLVLGLLASLAMTGLGLRAYFVSSRA